MFDSLDLHVGTYHAVSNGLVISLANAADTGKDLLLGLANVVGFHMRRLRHLP